MMGAILSLILCKVFMHKVELAYIVGGSRLPLMLYARLIDIFCNYFMELQNNELNENAERLKNEKYG